MENINSNKKIIIISFIAFLLLIVIGGTTYAFFNYQSEGTASNTLIAGDIYLDVTEGGDTLVLTNAFPETKEEARSHDGNTLTFTVNGTNESGKAILYNILLSEGTTKSGKTRFRDDEIMFDLIEINGNTETLLVDAKSFNSLSSTSIYDNLIPASTASVNHTYKLRAWINENVVISETETGDHVYSTYDYPNMYATVKVSVTGATVSGTDYTVTFDADGGTVPISTKNVVLGGDYGYLPTPTKEGYTFLGWNGKNMFNIDVHESLPSSTSSSNTTSRTFSLNTYVIGLAFNNYYSTTAVTSFLHNADSLNVESRSGYGVSYIFASDENSKFSFSYSVDSNKDEKNDTRVTIMFYKNDGSYIGKYDKNGCGSLNFQYYTPTDTYFMLINFANNNAIGTSSFSKIQLEEGNTATEYEPYFVTSDVKVTQEKNHTLKAIWKANS